MSGTCQQFKISVLVSKIKCEIMNRFDSFSMKDIVIITNTYKTFAVCYLIHKSHEINTYVAKRSKVRKGCAISSVVCV